MSLRGLTLSIYEVVTPKGRGGGGGGGGGGTGNKTI
jgi:hypothetical protein